MTKRENEYHRFRKAEQYLHKKYKAIQLSQLQNDLLFYGACITDENGNRIDPESELGQKLQFSKTNTHNHPAIIKHLKHNK